MTGREGDWKSCRGAGKTRNYRRKEANEKENRAPCRRDSRCVCVVKQTVFYLKLDIVQSGTPLLCYKLYFYCRVINMGFTDY